MDRMMQKCALMMLMLLTAGYALAQGVATAEMHVSVRDPKGAAVTDATVTARDEAKNFERTTSTNLDGEYPLLLLPPGAYTVTVAAPGFSKAVARNVVITVGQAAEVPITLQVATVTETVTVNAEAEMVETQQTSSTSTIEEKRIENLPINGRNYINFTLTTSQAARDTAPSIGAAPTSGINFGGQRARSNLVNVDGADAVDNSVNGIRSTVSQEAVQEFQIITNSYTAEYGRAAGGVVNIITKSGTNDFHGSAYGYLRNRAFQAVNPFSTTSNPAYTRVQAGFTLGGALKKNKAFYFVSYETTRRQETGFSTVGVDNFGLVPLPNAAVFGLPPNALVNPLQATFLATAPVNPFTVAYAQLAAGSSAVALLGTPGALNPLGFFPETGGPLPASYVNLASQTGNFPISEGTTVVSGRLDYRFNPNNTGMLRVNVSPSTVTGIEVNAQNQNFGQNAYSRTSSQSYRDFAITAQDSWSIGSNKINQFLFQYARRGLLYNFNTQTPAGSAVASNIVGFAFIGREPFSSLRRVEQRWQFADDFSIMKGTHTIKFGADINHVPVDAQFQVNFGGVYNFAGLGATSLSPAFAGFPGFSGVQAYGLGIPQTFVQGIGNPAFSASVTPLGFFVQDSWRIKPNLTLNYGVRYDVELAPAFAQANTLSAAAYNALNIQKGWQTDSNNIAPRIGLAWDPWKNGKTVIRASYGMFYDHPLLGISFLGEATDGVGTPQVLLFGGSPCNPAAPPSPANALNLNATNAFMGLLGVGNCLNPGAAAALGYVGSQQRFDPFFANSMWINQNFLAAGFPLINLPFGFPTGSNFVYAYSEQASLSVERDLGGGFALNVAYNFNGGHHLNRPINANPAIFKALVENWERANSWAVANAQPLFSDPFSVSTCNVGPAGPFVPAALMNFFRPSGVNPSLTGVFAACMPLVPGISSLYNLGLGVPVPFSDMVANYSNGSSVYHGMTVNLRKRFSHKYELLASYTWSHAIDDSTDLQSLLSPQDSFLPGLERANSTFDQRHRFVFSAVYQSGRLSGSGFGSKFFSDWTVAPIIEAASGRPFNIITAENSNFQFEPNSQRPNVVPAGTPTNACGFPTVPSSFSPTGFFQVPCFIDSNPLDGSFTGNLDGNLGRNPATKPSTLFTDLRIARSFHLGERVQLDGIVDMFNIINRYNVADVNPLYTQAGQPTAAFDPRQFQFALRLTW